MARKQTGQDAPGKGSPDQRKSRIRTSSVARPRSARNLSERSQSTRAKALHVLSDLRRDPKLTLSRAAKNREVSPRSIRKYIGSQLKQERPGGKLRVARRIPSQVGAEKTAVGGFVGEPTHGAKTQIDGSGGELT
jgi:hypothetical protein